MSESTDVRSMFDRAYIGAWDLVGRDATVTIAKVRAEQLRNKAGANKKPVVYFEGKERGFSLNKTNMKTIAGMYGYDTRAWIGKRITIYATKTAFGGEEVDAIRVRPKIPTGKGQPLELKPVDQEMRALQESARDKAEDEDERAAIEAEQREAERALGGES